MNVPVDKPVIIYLSSLDVIHSFAINEMRVKQDAIPGIQIPVWWVPTMAGNYEVNCSQLCGLGHYRMRGFVTVQTQTEYEGWLAGEAALLTGN
jgi:cytochrome c oxidase subunit 2